MKAVAYIEHNGTTWALGVDSETFHEDPWQVRRAIEALTRSFIYHVELLMTPSKAMLPQGVKYIKMEEL